MKLARDGHSHPTGGAELLVRARIAADLMQQADSMNPDSVAALVLRAVAMDIAEGIIGRKVVRP